MTATKLKVSNILDSIKPELDQRVFKGETPRPTLVDYIQRSFFEGMNKFVPDSKKYFDLYLTGSITTFQYGDDSDIDISIIPHYEELVKATGLADPKAVRKTLIKLVINKLDGRIAPGTPHTLQHFVVPPGTTINELFRPGLRSAWSFQTHKWIVPPEANRAYDVQRELPGLYLRAQNMADKMRVALDTDPATAKRLFERIHKKRSEDQQRGLGDFSEGNIIYKYLLHEGLFDRIKNELGVYIAGRNFDIDLRKDESLAYIWDRGRAYVGPYHYDILAENPQLEDETNRMNNMYTDIPNIWYAGRVYSDGDVLPWEINEGDPEMPERIKQDIRDATEGQTFVEHDAKTADFDVTLENPFNYRYIPLGPAEMVEWQNLSPEDKARWRQIAGRMNGLSRTKGKGNVSGEALHGLSYRYQGACAYCGQAKADSWEHVIPLSKGGMNTVDNLLPVHIQCNNDLNTYDQKNDPTPNPGGITLSPAWLQVQADTGEETKLLTETWNDREFYAIECSCGYRSNFDPDKEKVERRAAQHMKTHLKTANADRVQIIYDFEKDRIILGIKNAAGLPSTVVVGTYHHSDGSATLNETANQWINAKYFKKLWRTSFPSYPLKVVHFHSDKGHERIGAFPTPLDGQELSDYHIEYYEAFMYVGEPYNELEDSGSSEHYELVYDFCQKNHIEDDRVLDTLSILLGHLGAYETINPETYESYNQYVADFQSHSMGRLNTDSAALKQAALEGLRKLGYTNVIDVSGQLGKRWWTT